MNNLKKRIFVALAVIMIGIAIFPIVETYAANLAPSGCQISMEAKIGSTEMVSGGKYLVKGGEKITVNATSSYADIVAIGYRYEENGVKGPITDVLDKEEATITIPTKAAGTILAIEIEAVNKNDKGNPNTVTKTGWIPFYLIYGDINAKVGTSTLTPKSTTNVKVGSQVTVQAVPDSQVAKIYYSWDNNGTYEIKNSELKVTVPTDFKVGSTHTLYVTARYTNGKDLAYKEYYFKIIDSTPQPSEKDIIAKIGTKTLIEGERVTVNVGTLVKLTATPEDEVTRLYYSWDNESEVSVTESSYTVKVPSSFKEGTTHTLYVRAKYDDGEILDYYQYRFLISGDDEEPSDRDITAKIGTKILTEGKTTTVYTGVQIKLTATPEDEVVRLYYSWDDEDETSVSSSSYTVKVPSSFKDGTTHILYVTAKYDDGEILDYYKYKFLIDEDNPYDDEDDDDELIIEPWMRENKELSQLAVSLRNDSDGTKYNRNIYALDEEIIYYVDYKNGGKDITSKITLVLNLPLNFKVVDADGGAVSTSKNTITWTWNKGLERDESGTKTVIIKYTSLGKSSIYSKVVYPIADIKKDSKIIDSSTVINLIFKEEGQKIGETHFPYMYGDKNATTFRPDDTITRGEVALVVTRVFGINTSSVRVTNMYPDIGETYEEAQKALIAASAYGLFNGYTDGKVRPNEPMTRAEFMKVIAKRIETEASEDDIRGLEIKDYSNSIKLYKNTGMYYNSNTDHWALNSVTLLARLNMTSVNKERDLRLDDYITRAEAAQLMNYYLLRAPAKNTSSSNTARFSDVYSGHRLYGDIVEATRDSHEFSLTEDGREVIK